MHIAPCRGRESDIKEVFYDCEVETCVVDPGSDVGSSKFCVACFEEFEHAVHGCALQVSKSRQTHEHCVAEDLVLKPGSEAVRDVVSWRGMLRVALPSCPLCLLDIDEQVVD